MTQLLPVPRRSVVDEAYDALRARILHGVWSPGDRLPTEHALTEALGVSRSTVREALARLGSDGLIHVPHGGSKTVLDWRDHAGLEVLAGLVATPAGEPSVPTIRAVVEMRQAIAPDVARLAAERRTAEQAARLVDQAERLHASASLEALLDATMGWWTTLVLASGNLAYRLAFNTLRTTYTEGRGAMLPVIADELRALGLYRSAALAVRDGDADGARAATAQLVAIGSDAMHAALDALEGA